MTPRPDDPTLDDTLAAALAAFDDARAAGQPPPAPPADADLTPDARDRLARDRAIVEMLDRLWPRTPDGELSPAAAAEAFRFGRFRVVRKLGAGGFGVVFLADDPVLGRPVALKVPRPETLHRPDLRKRFLREARAAALLSHPNIVAVYDAGEGDGVCYIAAEYCPGPTLAKWLAGQAAPLAPAAAAALIADLADAIGYAHRRGVVHRDLKPGNVLLANGRREPAGAPGGEEPAGSRRPFAFAPKITDFGVAKLIEAGGDQTRDGTLIGTPDYMAPEQAAGKPSEVGPPADVYALGAILYQLLAGRPPHQGETPADSLRRAVADPPRSVRRDRPDVPRDLEAVCLKCLAKDPARRYPDGAALADDLQRFLGGRPTLARPVRWPERAGKWARRNPAVAGLLAAVFAALAGLAAQGAVYNRDLSAQNLALRWQKEEADKHREKATQEAIRSERRRLQARGQAYLADMRYAGGLLAQGRRPTGDLVRGWEPGLGEEDFRGWEWQYLRRLGRAADQWIGHADRVAEVAVGSGGRFVASRAGGAVFVWDEATGRRVSSWEPKAGPLTLAAVAPDGRQVAASVGPRAGPAVFVLYDTAGHCDRLRRSLPPGDRLESAGYSADGGRLLVHFTSRVELLDPRAGETLRTLPVEGSPVAAALSADGRTAAVWAHPPGGEWRFRLTLFDADTGRPRGDLPTALTFPFRLAVSPDGARVGCLSEANEQVEVWDAAARVRVSAGRFPKQIGNVLAFVPDGRLVATGWGQGDSAGEMRFGVWEPPGRWAVRSFALVCAADSVAVMPDGKRLVIGGVDHTVRLLTLDPPPAFAGWAAHGPKEAWAVAWSPDGTAVVTGGDDGRVRVWDAATKALRADILGHRIGDEPELVTDAAFAPDGMAFATAGYDNAARIWAAADPAGTPPRVLPHPARVQAVAYSPDGRLLVTACDDTLIRVWSADGVLRHALPGHTDRPKGLAFVGPGVVVSVGNDGTIRWWDAAAGRALQVVRGAGTPTCVAASPDGLRLAVGTGDGHLTLWDARGGQPLGRFPGPPPRVQAVAYSPDGRTVATAGRDGSIRLWRAQGQELFALPGGDARPYRLAFSPDGTTLLAARHDGTVTAWTTKGE